jgi:hypothetical protein
VGRAPRARALVIQTDDPRGGGMITAETIDRVTQFDRFVVAKHATDNPIHRRSLRRQSLGR